MDDVDRQKWNQFRSRKIICRLKGKELKMKKPKQLKTSICRFVNFFPEIQWTCKKILGGSWKILKKKQDYLCKIHIKFCERQCQIMIYRWVICDFWNIFFGATKKNLRESKCKAGNFESWYAPSSNTENILWNSFIVLDNN